MAERGRGDWVLLSGLLAILLGVGYFVFRTHEDGVESQPIQTRADQRPRSQPADPLTHDRPDRGAVESPAVEPRLLPDAPLVTAAHDRVYDPQRMVMRREFQITTADAGAALPFQPLERGAAISLVNGTVPFDHEASCTVRVLPAQSGRFNCLVRVVCGGQIVYPNQAQTAGYMRCELGAQGRPVRAEDQGHSALDGDPLVRFDLETGTLVVEDRGDGVEAFSVSMQIDR